MLTRHGVNKDSSQVPPTTSTSHHLFLPCFHQVRDTSQEILYQLFFALVRLPVKDIY